MTNGSHQQVVLRKAGLLLRFKGYFKFEVTASFKDFG